MPHIRYEVMGGLGAVIKSLKEINSEHFDNKSFVIAEISIFPESRTKNTKYARLKAGRKHCMKRFNRTPD